MLGEHNHSLLLVLRSVHVPLFTYMIMALMADLLILRLCFLLRLREAAGGGVWGRLGLLGGAFITAG